MYCSECGSQLATHAKFCSNCGQAASPHVAPYRQGNPSASPVATVDTTESTQRGTMWLNFWTYFSLPVGVLLNLYAVLLIPKPMGRAALGLILLPYCLLQLAVAYGLHRRKLWAWQWNWVIVVASFIVMCLPQPLFSHRFRGADLFIVVTWRAIIAGLLWLWPNFVYWRKRRSLFS